MEKGKERTYRSTGFKLYHQNIPKKQLKAHLHNECHLIIPLQGVVELEVEGHCHHFGPGRMIYIGGLVPHSFSGQGEMGERLVLQFDRQLNKRFNKLGKIVAVVPTHPFVKELLLGLFSYSEESFGPSMVKLVLEVLSVSLLNQTDGPKNALFQTQQKILKSQDSQFKRLVELMSNDLDKDLEELASKIGTSPRSMSRLVQSEVGMAPKELYTFFRIQHACDLIFKGELNLTGVAFECGYSSLSQFILNFKRWTGQRPSDFSR